MLLLLLGVIVADQDATTVTVVRRWLVVLVDPSHRHTENPPREVIGRTAGLACWPRQPPHVCECVVKSAVHRSLDVPT